MDYSFFQWGPFAITGLTFSIVLSLLVSLYLFYGEGLRKGLNADRIITFILVFLVGVFGGARLFYVYYLQPEYYRQNPGEIMSLQDGGLSFYGGLAGAMLCLGLWSALTRFSVKSYVDAAAPPLALGLALSRIGTPPSGQTVSSVLPWAMQVGDKYIHPDQVYMIILLFVLFFMMWNKRLNNSNYQGEMIVWFLAGYGLIDFVVEFFRNSPGVFGFISAGHLAAFFLVAAVCLYAVYSKKEKTATFYQYDTYLFKRRRILAGQAVFLVLFLVISVYLHFLLYADTVTGFSL